MRTVWATIRENWAFIRTLGDLLLLFLVAFGWLYFQIGIDPNWLIAILGFLGAAIGAAGAIGWARYERDRAERRKRQVITMMVVDEMLTNMANVSLVRITWSRDVKLVDTAQSVFDGHFEYFSKRRVLALLNYRKALREFAALIDERDAFIKAESGINIHDHRVETLKRAVIDGVDRFDSEVISALTEFRLGDVAGDGDPI